MPDFMPMEDLDSFDPVAKIVVIGVGGAGNNAVNRMIDDNIQNVEFYVCNTDKQALSTSKAPNRIALGEEGSKGLGAGGDPSEGKKAAEASLDKIKPIVEGADMVFIAAGMGKGTGTGAAPVIAKCAKEAGALTVAIVTRPFEFEGQVRGNNAIEGINKLQHEVDALMVVSNDKLLTVSSKLAMDQALEDSDKVLASAVKTVADLVLTPSKMNLDFADVKATLSNSGRALIGSGKGDGPDKAIEAAERAINLPLLESGIAGARRAICSVTIGNDVTLFEAQAAVQRVTEAAAGPIDVKFGVTINDQLEDSMIVSVIACDFDEETSQQLSDEVFRTNSRAFTEFVNKGTGVSSATDQIVQAKKKEDVQNNSESNISGFVPDFMK
ncbi:MAG: cell division protein FtsZ [Bacilli bacterium]|nr:cell division protein FtsZ [Bacilli bacterium]